LPSYREGLPRSIIEAMAMNKPIIATDIRGCREEVFPGKNGFLVPKATVNPLKEAMNKMIEDDKKTAEFGQKSRKIVEQLFDEEKVLQKQIDLFNNILSENKG